MCGGRGIIVLALTAFLTPGIARAEPEAKAVGGLSALRDHANRLSAELDKARAAAAKAERDLEAERQRARKQADQALDRDFAREREHGEETARFEKEFAEARARLAEAKRALEEKARRIASVEDALAKVEAEEKRVSEELRRAKDERKQLTARLGTLEKEITTARKQEEETAEELAASQKDVREKDSRIDTLGREIASVRKEKEETAEKLVASQKDAREKHSKLDALGREIASVRKEKEETSTKLVATAKKVADKESELTAVQASLAKSQEQLRQQEADVGRLTAELEQSRTESQQRIAALTAELRDLQGVREQADQLRAEAKRHADRATALEAEADGVRKTLDEQQKTAAVAGEKQKEEIAALRGRANELEKDLVATREQHELAAGLAEKLEKERDESRRRLEQAKQDDGVDLERKTKQLHEHKRELAALKKELAVAKEAAVAAAPTPELDFSAPMMAAETDEPAELQRLLALERERRATLEGELVRLSATGEVAERYRESWQGLQAARADLLLLAERLGAEQKRREELEAEVAKAREAAADGTAEKEAPLERLVEVADDHSRETDQLEKELRDATEEVVRLKGRLETIDSAQSAGPVLKELHEENEKLRVALKGAETKLVMLEGQAALAKRLAELVYSR